MTGESDGSRELKGDNGREREIDCNQVRAVTCKIKFRAENEKLNPMGLIDCSQQPDINIFFVYSSPRHLFPFCSLKIDFRFSPANILCTICTQVQVTLLVYGIFPYKLYWVCECLNGKRGEKNAVNVTATKCFFCPSPQFLENKYERRKMQMFCQLLGCFVLSFRRENIWCGCGYRERTETRQIRFI